VLEEETKVINVNAGLGTQYMGMVIYPCFPFYLVGDPTGRFKEVASVFSEKNKRLIKKETVNRSLLPIGSIVWIRSRISFCSLNGPSLGIQKLDNFP